MRIAYALTQCRGVAGGDHRVADLESVLGMG